MFEVLRVPGQPREHVLEVATCRFADGREIELDRFPLVETMKRAQTLRAEEMVVSTPGGRSLRVLLNATPIHAETARSGRWWPPRRTWRRWRRSIGCGPTSWGW